MAKKNLSALLGMHDQLADACKGMLETFEYSIDLANDKDEMIDKINSKDYFLCIMDLNLGNPNSDDISPSIEVYNALNEKYKSEKPKFFGVSGNTNAIKNAEKQGIPYIQKDSRFAKKIMDFIE